MSENEPAIPHSARHNLAKLHHQAVEPSDLRRPGRSAAGGSPRLNQLPQVPLEQRRVEKALEAAERNRDAPLHLASQRSEKCAADMFDSAQEKVCNSASCAAPKILNTGNILEGRILLNHNAR